MELADFHPLRGEFLRLLARASDVDAHELGITDVRSGCVIVVVRMPIDAAKRIIQRFRHRRLTPAQNDDLFSTFNIEQVREEIAVRDKVFASRASSPPTLDWLHLSDLHVRGTPQEDDWYGDLCRDLPSLIREGGLSPRFILVSGDLAASGQVAQYEKSREVLDRVRQCMPSSDIPVISCPGNHDIEWSAIDPSKEKAFRTRVVEDGPDQLIGDLLQKANDRNQADLAHLMARHRNFEEHLAAEWGPPVTYATFTQGVLASAVEINVDNTRVGVAMFNSALISSRDDLLKLLGVPDEICAITPAPDYGFLALSDAQLREGHRMVSQADVRIALLHHPPLSAWFSEADKVNHRTWLPEFDVVHRGHEHTPSNEQRSPIGLIDSTFEIAAGALRTSPTSFTGFTAVSVDRAAGTIRTTNWTFGDRVRRWHLDTLASRSGTEERAVGEGLRHRLLLSAMASV